ncbi:hypothetical protein OKW40_002480 [Paraburkholderia sp. RAU6.4a]|uniref:hypothetical protein n=1 Tax=Paraburkholderia sp. RAU6.4a TaxID=2991067 RepID=UPI003D195533
MDRERIRDIKVAFGWIAIAGVLIAAAWHYSPEIRQTFERWTCSYKLGDNCVTQDEYMRSVARAQADLAILEWQVFCMTPSNRGDSRCTVFFMH